MESSTEWKHPGMHVWIRSLAYMVLVGGGWLIALPAALLYAEYGYISPTVRGTLWFASGSIAFVGGTLLAIVAGYQLVTVGQGTPFPLDPTQHLVTSGPYGYIRNPQGVAMVMMTTGVVLCIQSAVLWIMVPLTLVYLEVIVAPYENKLLDRQFGSDYRAYKTRVRKWYPKPPEWQ